MANRQTLCLIDGSGYIFRAFYALPPMTRPDGTPINAVYGFTNMMMNLTEENNCTRMLVIFDAKRQNFRNQIYPHYKENRKETPPELIPQFALIRQACDALNIPWTEQEGYEADDLIATYADKAVKENIQVQIISADKDLMQLMRDGVSLYDPMKKKEIVDSDVMAKFGVSPDKIVDVQSLMGDAIDNVPGAEGIGPKTAAQLINQYGSLDNLLSHLEEIPQKKRREGLIRDRDQILISRQLVTLKSDVPNIMPLSDFSVKEPNFTQLRAFLTENGFKSLLARLQNWKPKCAPETINTCLLQPQKNYSLIQEESELKQWLSQIRDKVSIDTETTGLNPMQSKLVGFSLGIGNGQACYIPLRHGEDIPLDLFTTDRNIPKQIPISKVLALLKPILVNPDILKIGHNIKYDMHIIAQEYGPDFQIFPIDDTMVMSAVLNGSNHGHSLDELAKIYLNYTTIKYDDICGSGKNKIPFNKVDLNKACAYAAEDADITFRLYEVFSRRLKEEDTPLIYQSYDKPLIPILYKMEEVGILVDKKHLKNTGDLFMKKLEGLIHSIHALAGEEFNVNSPAQLGNILFEKQGLPGGKKGANGAYITDSKVLEKLSADGSELAQKILDYRGYAKLKSTYVDALLERAQKDPRIHTSFSLTSTNTGRLASSDPNLQNIPIRTDDGKEIRRSFIAQEGYKILAADYSQIELRLMAEVAEVKALKEAFIHNEDIHTRTAAQIFHMPLNQINPDIRRRAKAINFGIIYGISAFGLANNLGLERQEAQKYIDAYFEQYPEIKAYMRNTEQFARTHGYVLTPFGRKCFIQGLDSGRTKSFALRAAINAPIQGGAADIIKKAMQQIDLQLKQWDARLLLQVHDELVFEVKESDIPEVTLAIKNIMENVVRLSIPLIAEVGVGNNWKEAH